VVTLHDLIIQTYYDPRTLPLRQQIFSGWNLRRAIKAEAVVAVSEYGRDQIVDYFNCPADRIHVIPNSIDFPPNSDPEVLRRWGVAAPYLLFAGSYEPRKNLTGALEAFASLVGDGLPHQLVAVVERESGHSPGIRPLIERLGLVDRVRLVDSLPESDLRALYTQAEALFFPSFAEGFGYPPLQAAACGLPAVVSDLPPLRETLGTWPVFGELLGDAGARARMRAAGPDLAAKFSLVGNVGAHLDVYRSLTLGR
jgi:glycosyltransferase involved in cell wall biosynthesis